jgi:hypothetical protein
VSEYQTEFARHADILPALVQGIWYATRDDDHDGECASRRDVVAAGLRSYWLRLDPREQQDLLDLLDGEYGLGLGEAVRIAVLHGAEGTAS